MPAPDTVWTEKYRPKEFSQIKGQDEIVSRVQAFIEAENMPHLLFVGPAGVGKCVTEETKIVAGDGRVLAIGKAHEQNVESVLSVQPNGEIAPQPVAYHYKDEAERTIHVSTQSGAQLTATPEHPFLVLRNGKTRWVQAEDLTAEDRIATPTKLPHTKEEPGIAWTHENAWCTLEEPQTVPTEELLSAAKKQVFAQLPATAAEVAQATGLHRNTVRYHLKALADKHYAQKKDREWRPEPNNETDNVPLRLAENTVKTVYWKPHTGGESHHINWEGVGTAAYYEWLGLVYGDGNIRNASVRFYNSDEQLREHFTTLTKHVFGNVPTRDVQDTTPYIEIRRATTITRLIQDIHGIRPGKKSDKIRIPKELFTAPKEHVSAFLRGWFEADGTYTPERGSVEITSTSEEIIEQAHYLLRQHGIDVKVRQRKNSSELAVRGANSVRAFRKLVQPRFKTIPPVTREANTNVDVMEIDERLTTLLRRFGIKQKTIDPTGSVLETGRGSREKVLRCYEKVEELVRERLRNALEAIQAISAIKDDGEGIGEVLEGLSTAKARREVMEQTGIRYDRLKEYSDGKRVPSLDAFSRIACALARKQDRLFLHRSSSLLAVRDKAAPVLKTLGITQRALKEASEDTSAHYLVSGDGLLISSLTRIRSVLAAAERLIAERVFEREAIDTLENISFLAKADLRWEQVQSVEERGPATVYDLNVHDTHNFIGGSGPLVLHNTTLAMVASRQLFGDDWRSNTLELNASDERGIDVVRNTIKDFARTRSMGGAPFKIIYLDEADSLTKEAQQALRRTMESYTGTCRFILSCNYSSKIIDPIQSRCAVFKFKPLPKDDILDIIDTIADEEGLTISDDTKEALYEVSGGDVRRLENVLQSCAVLSDEITEKAVYEMASVARPKEIKDVLELAGKGSFLKARDKLLDTQLEYGMSGLDVIKQVQREVWDLDVSNEKKLVLVEACGEAEFRMVEGSDEFVQLEALLAKFVQK